MSALQSTPGPWHLNENPRFVEGPEHNVVAQVYSLHGMKGNEEANARLIAAAPEMLEALKGLKASFGDPMTRRALGGHNERQQAAILAASAVIAKAKGG